MPVVPVAFYKEEQIVHQTYQGIGIAPSSADTAFNIAAAFAVDEWSDTAKLNPKNLD